MSSKAEHPSPNSAPDRCDFRLLWTVGFSGKRFLPDEEKVRIAIDEALRDLLAKADAVDARLTAVSSLARGADVLFAEACARAGIPWRCLLPFAWKDFLRFDLPDDPDKSSHPAERADRLARAERLRRNSFGVSPRPTPGEAGAEASNVFPDPLVVTQGVVVEDQESRDSAYQDCSYQTVDESDVMICVLNDQEFREGVAKAKGEPGHSSVKTTRAGTKATALYAHAARRPCILLNSDAENPWASRKEVNPPESREAGRHFGDHAALRSGWFVDPVVTHTIHAALKHERPETNDKPPGWHTPTRDCVWALSEQLGGLAGYHQEITRGGLLSILRLHLTATLLAALCVTVLILSSAPPWWFWVLAALAVLKAALVFAAWQKEKRLHRAQHRDRWLNARILAGFCRSAYAMWPLPLQPLDASDEEDFPLLKRLIRTLRLLRAMDPDAGVRASHREAGETSLEANMRVACEHYRDIRLFEQANDYFGRKGPGHVAEEKRWRRRFKASLWCAIIAALTLASLHVWHYYDASPTHHILPHWFERTLEALLIMAPFFATYCLGMITILDSRRRSARYEEMRHYLHRLADTLSNCSSNPSRLRLIEHAERMLIEEQHEWFSATRNANV